LLQGVVGDPSGDAAPDPTVAVSPDLVGATIEVAGGVVTFNISFAPGTLSHSTTFWTVLLDTDENPSTGSVIQGIDTFLGNDYVVQGQGDAASVFRLGTAAVPGQPVPGTRLSDGVVVTFLTNDTISVATPLSVLGSDDGRLKFRVTARPNVNGMPASTANDYMPDVGTPPGIVR